MEGDTRYDEQAIIQASGIRVGQSVFSLNLKLAAQNVLSTFPYLETVDIQKVSFGTVRIALKEVEAIGRKVCGWFLDSGGQQRKSTRDASG